MSLPRDIEKYVFHAFSADEADAAIKILCAAQLHDGSKPSDRLIRCMLVAAKGRLSGLIEMADLIAKDYRDVIVSGEYEQKDGELVQTRDLSQPFSQGAA